MGPWCNSSTLSKRDPVEFWVFYSIYFACKPWVAGSNPALPAIYGEVAQFGRATYNVKPVDFN